MATVSDLEAAAENALMQIKERRYDEILRGDGREDILAYGISVRGDARLCV